MRAVLHKWKANKYIIWGIAYGSNPYGPKGGRCGNIEDGKMLITRCGTGNYGIRPPDWMMEAKERLNNEKPLKPEIEQKFGTGKFTIIDKGVKANV